MLLQRQALSFTRPGASLTEVSADYDKPKARLIDISFYNDSECTVQEGANTQASAETDFCAMDWNFTCSCDVDQKVIVATHYDNCASKQVVTADTIPLGQCVQGTMSGSGGNTYMLVRDMGTCPCCGATCTVYGDPHITVFDKTEVALLKTSPSKASHGNSEFMPGDFWLVRSELVQIQARYRRVRYTGAKHLNHTYLTGLAVGGPFLKGNILRIGPDSTGKVEWVHVEDQTAQSILERPGSFKADDLLTAHFRPNGKLVKDPTQDAKAFFFQLPSGVKLEVNRFKKHMDVSITMGATSGGPDGVDGQCGNFNGDPRDDTSALIEDRMGEQIPHEDSLFAVADAAKTIALNASSSLVSFGHGVTPVLLEVKPPKVATATTYTDSKCEHKTDFHGTYTLGADHCELGWNFTCGCSVDSKVVVAVRMTPGCENATGMEVLQVPAGECLEPGRFSNMFPNDYFMMDASECPSCCEGQVCTIHGDPHVTGFDQAQVALVGGHRSAKKHEGKTHENMYGWGDFWLVKSDEVLVQARYRKVYYPGAKQPLNHTYLTAIAVAGPFLQGNKLIVEPQSGNITWKHANGTSSVFEESEDTKFILKDLGVKGKFHNRTAIVAAKFHGKANGADFHLPYSVVLRVDRFGKHLDAELSMPRSSGGNGEFDGQCGNFNGDPDDDTPELIDERVGFQVPAAEVLFEADSLQGLDAEAAQ